MLDTNSARWLPLLRSAGWVLGHGMKSGSVREQSVLPKGELMCSLPKERERREAVWEGKLGFLLAWWAPRGPRHTVTNRSWRGEVKVPGSLSVLALSCLWNMSKDHVFKSSILWGTTQILFLECLQRHWSIVMLTMDRGAPHSDSSTEHFYSSLCSALATVNYSCWFYDP